MIFRWTGPVWKITTNKVKFRRNDNRAPLIIQFYRARRRVAALWRSGEAGQEVAAPGAKAQQM
jgi:hypothetical protein